MLTLENQNIEHIKSFLNNLSDNEWIYPGQVVKKTGLSIKEVYETLSILENLGYVKGYYKLHCSKCDSEIDSTFETFNSLPATFVCTYCNYRDLSIKNSILIYKKMLN